MITNLERVIKREQDQKYNEGRTEGREELLTYPLANDKKEIPKYRQQIF